MFLYTIGTSAPRFAAACLRTSERSGCLSLFFSSGYVVIRATKLEAVWEALLAGEPDIQARSAEFGIQSILPRTYRAPMEPDKVDGA